MIKSKDKIHKSIIENQALKNSIRKRVTAQISIDKAMDLKIIIIKFLLIKAAIIKANISSRKNIQVTSKL